MAYFRKGRRQSRGVGLFSKGFGAQSSPGGGGGSTLEGQSCRNPVVIPERKKRHIKGREGLRERPGLSEELVERDCSSSFSFCQAEDLGPKFHHETDASRRNLYANRFSSGSRH